MLIVRFPLSLTLIRLSFTPDGSLLITPTGLHAVSTDNAPAAGPAEVLRDTTYVFSRANLQRWVFFSGTPAFACLVYEQRSGLLFLLFAACLLSSPARSRARD